MACTQLHDFMMINGYMHAVDLHDILQSDLHLGVSHPTLKDICTAANSIQCLSLQYTLICE